MEVTKLLRTPLRRALKAVLQLQRSPLVEFTSTEHGFVLLVNRLVQVHYSSTAKKLEKILVVYVVRSLVRSVQLALQREAIRRLGW